MRQNNNFVLNSFLTYCFVFLTLGAFAQSVQTNQTTCKKASILLTQLGKYHIQPVTIDEKVSGEIFDDFIKLLDPKGLYFTKTDLIPFAKYRTQLLPQINSGNCAFLNDLSKLYKLKLTYADTLIKFHTRLPFTYTSNETIQFKSLDNKGLSLTENDFDLNKKWNTYLKYQTLKALFQPTAANTDFLQTDAKAIMINEPKCREKIRKLNIRRIGNIIHASEGLDNYIGNHFLNAIANRFDPHSIYFTPSAKEDFQSMISRDGKSFGFYLNENKNGEIEISGLIPGGNAWKTNELNIGDVVISMKFGNASAIDFTYLDKEEIEEIIEANQDVNTLELIFRKANGQIKTVQLHKEMTEQEDNIVKSYLLNGNKRIGYISLPSFYDEWEERNPLGCGNDVAIEINKLQHEKIDGLILDLRFNGGGSLREAVNLSGIFINEGPVCVLKDRDAKTTVIKDMNRGTAYDGPLLVMVNAYSASASEMTAAVLQDYHRAIIVGNTTFGKGTSQSTFPLDLSYQPEAPLSSSNNYGFANITRHKFYRITTQSHQNKGVQPDIFLPDFSYFAENNEASNKYSIPTDVVTKNLYYTALPAIPVGTLDAKSKQRVDINPKFKEIIQINDSINLLNKETNVSLNLEKYRVLKKSYKAIDVAIEKLSGSLISTYTVLNNEQDKKIFNVNDFSKQLNDASLKELQSDFYIEEAYHIISDLINTK